MGRKTFAIFLLIILVGLFIPEFSRAETYCPYSKRTVIGSWGYNPDKCSCSKSISGLGGQSYCDTSFGVDGCCNDCFAWENPSNNGCPWSQDDRCYCGCDVSNFCSLKGYTGGMGNCMKENGQNNYMAYCIDTKKPDLSTNDDTISSDDSNQSYEITVKNNDVRKCFLNNDNDAGNKNGDPDYAEEVSCSNYSLDSTDDNAKETFLFSATTSNNSLKVDFPSPSKTLLPGESANVSLNVHSYPSTPGTYYIYVTATSDKGNKTSDTLTLKYVVCSSPGPPGPPVSPQNLKIDGQDCSSNPTGISINPTVSWDSQPGVAYYMIQLDDRNNNPLGQPFFVNGTSTDLSQSGHIPLDNNTTYIVYVSPCVGNNPSYQACNPGLSSSCVFTTVTSSGGVQIPNPLSSNDIPTLLEHIISYLFTLSLVLGPLFIVIGALCLLVSGGDINKVQRGKNIILYTVIGMTIIILSRVIIGLVKSIITG